ncbi:Histidine kinase [Lentibacillus sp. JNUCC-1]|uniref:sensor histidine kinase n=1 Tax=Lentibacillus sp. JNUCC-1 TaxID=2654513 RepID=UPI0012E772E2|nr:HAMP domain-containing sensor histidine kinase [Lentibacillus sp. JNUCC-1]MUV38215.1 Histidine kinase [Lentibacillus sp. JNUCC-1]
MKTLYIRIIVTTMVIMITSAIIAFVVTNVYYHYELKPQNDEKITGIAERVAGMIESDAVDENNYLRDLSHLGYQFYLVKPDGDSKMFGDRFRSYELEDGIIEEVLAGKTYHGVANYPWQLFVTGFFDNELRNTIGVLVELEGEKRALFVRPNAARQFGEMRFFLAVILVATLLLSFLFILTSTTFIVHPIKKLTAATKKIAAGNYHIKLDEKRRDEIGRLARDFSRMSDSLQQTEAQRQTFVSNVSHEIQSPLTSIQGFSRAIREEDMTDEERAHYLGIIEKESKRLSNLSRQLLTLSFLDRDNTTGNMKQFDLAKQLRDVVSVTEWQWREKELSVEVDLAPAMMTGDPEMLQQVWTNLLTNAIRYTDKGGSIKVRTSEDRTLVYVTVEDTGIGIRDEELTHVFERFYKVDKARTRTENSTGLGLSIVKKIIEVHDGTITVTSELGKGSTFHVTLPKSQP